MDFTEVRREGEMPWEEREREKRSGSCSGLIELANDIGMPIDACIQWLVAKLIINNITMF